MHSLGRIWEHCRPAPAPPVPPPGGYQDEAELAFGDQPQKTELSSLESEDAELILCTWRPARVHTPNRARARNERSSRR